jgi:predicted RNase H-like nuclease (RuvC/YqgF family)
MRHDAVSAGGHSAVALSARAGRLLEAPPDRAQVEEVQLLLTELSGIVLQLETQRRRFRRRFEAGSAGAEAEALRRRFNRLGTELSELDAMREPLRRRRAELGA